MSCTVVSLLIPISSSPYEWFESSAPALVLVALARAGVSAALVHAVPGPGPPLLALSGNDKVGSVATALTAAIASLEFPNGVIPRRVEGPTQLPNTEALSLCAVETSVVGALLAGGWAHAGGCASSGAGGGVFFKASGLWTRQGEGHERDEGLREAATIDLSVSPAPARRLALWISVKGGVVRVSRAGAVGSVVYVTPALAPCVLLAGAGELLNAHDAAVMRLLNFRGDGRWARVLPPSSSSRALLGVVHYGEEEEEEENSGPSSCVPADTLWGDAVGLRTSSREHGAVTSRAIITLLSSLPGVVVVAGGNDYDKLGAGADAGAGAGAGAGVGADTGGTLGARPLAPQALPAPKFIKASALEARSSSNLFAAAPIQTPATPFSAFLADAVRIQQHMTLRSAGDVVRGSGGMRVSGVANISMAPPSATSACWLARTRPDAAAALLTVERPPRALLLWPLTSADCVAPLSLSDLVPLHALTAQLAYYKKVAPVVAATGVADAVMAAAFASVPFALSIRASSAADMLRSRCERTAVDVAAGAAPVQADNGDIAARNNNADENPSLLGGDEGGGDEHGPFGAVPTAAKGPPVKKQKVPAVEVAAPSGAEAAAAAATSARLAAAVASIANNEVALGRESVAALKAFLKATGLALSGSKAVLVQRVLSRPRPKAAAAAPPLPRLRFALMSEPVVAAPAVAPPRMPVPAAAPATVVAPPAAAPAPVVAPSAPAPVLRFAQLDDDDDL